MKKKILFVILLCTIAVMAYLFYNTDRSDIIDAKINLDFSNLNLDQKEAFISLSKNDISGYNRWVPFYFNLTTKEDLSEEKVEALLNEKILKASLSTNDGVFYQTDQLIFSVGKSDENFYHLTLVVIPEVGELSFDGGETITQIELSSSDNSYKYELPSYLIEERETLLEDELSVSISSMLSEIQENLSASIDYGIEKNGYEITNLNLDFPSDFSNIKDYQVVNSVQTEDGSVEYSIIAHLNDNSSGTIFRPFLHVEYGEGKSGWLIPSVPVLFN